MAFDYISAVGPPPVLTSADGGSTTRYKSYNKQLSAWVGKAQAADPEFQAWQNLAASYGMDNQGAIPQWEGNNYIQIALEAQPPEIQQDYQKVGYDVERDNARSFKGRLGTAMSLIPGAVLGVGAAPLVAGLFGAAAGTAGAAGAETMASLTAEGLTTAQAAERLAQIAQLTNAGTTAANVGANAVNITASALPSAAATATGAALGSAATLPFNLDTLPPPGAGPQQPPTDPTNQKVEVTAPADPTIPPIPPITPEISDPHFNVAQAPEPMVEPELADPHTNQTPTKEEPWSFDKMIKYAQNMSGADWVKAGLGTLSMYNMVKGMSGGPDAPDLSKLREQDLLANRPNEENAAGDTLTRTQNPDGSWTYKTKYGAPNQGLFNAGVDLKGGLLEQAKNTAPLTTAGLPTLGGKVMNPEGNNDAITQAWLARMQPELDRGRSREMQRLANMGVTENRMGGENQAFGNAMDVLNRKDVDATNQALIYGTDAYNKTFQNSIQADSADRQNFQTGFDANKAVANNPYFQLNQVNGAIPGEPTFAGGGGVSNIAGGESADYKIKLDAANAKLAQNEKNLAGMWDLYKSFG